MMTLNNNEKDFQKKMQQDTEIPAIVHEHINQAYHLIENNTVTQKKAPRDPFHWMKIGCRHGRCWQTMPGAQISGSFGMTKRNSKKLKASQISVKGRQIWPHKFSGTRL